jgi:hypothetical protein
MRKWTRTYLLATFLGAALSAGAGAGEGRNLLTNAGLEEPVEAGAVPPGWFQSRANPAISMRDGGHSGQGYVRLIDRAPNESIPLESRRIPARPGGVYRGAAWIRTRDPGSPGIFVNFYDDIGRRLDNFPVRVDGPTEGWKRVEVVAEAPAHAWFVTLMAYAYQAAIGTYDFE